MIAPIDISTPPALELSEEQMDALGLRLVATALVQCGGNGALALAMLIGTLSGFCAITADPGHAYHAAIAALERARARMLSEQLQRDVVAATGTVVS